MCLSILVRLVFGLGLLFVLAVRHLEIFAVGADVHPPFWIRFRRVCLDIPIFPTCLVILFHLARLVFAEFLEVIF